MFASPPSTRSDYTQRPGWLPPEMRTAIDESTTPNTLESLPPVPEFDASMDKVTSDVALSTSSVPTHAPPPAYADAAAADDGYEEVPPWNQPRSVDDIHFVYSMTCESMGCRIVRLMALLIPAQLIVAGALNLSNCRLAPQLPYWAISVGAMWFLHCGFYFLFRKSQEKNTMGYRFIKGIFLFVAMAVFVFGVALTYGNVSRLDFSSSPGNEAAQCSLILFFSALGLVSIGWLFVAVFLWFYTFTFTFSWYEPTAEQSQP